jgi:glycosyltransferase involved in cell wall biosynthesis
MLRVLTVYHAGRDPQQRERTRALSAAGAEITLVVPSQWPEPGAQSELSPEPFVIRELAVRRAGDVNRHQYADSAALRALLDEVAPDVLDIHAEPFSAATAQWLAALGPRKPVVIYTAQNIDKRFPPPFAGYERAALARAGGLYPCSRQAASVARGKGFTGTISVLPLGYDDELFRPGEQTLATDEITLLLAGRLVAEKGVEDAVRVLAAVNAVRPARLVLAGEGPAGGPASALASSLGLARQLDLVSWRQGEELAALYRAAHFVLVPSRATQTWAEQFGRVITEAQASGAVVAGYASGAIAEIAGEGGIIVPAGDLDRLAGRVSDVASYAGEFEARRAAGQREAAKRAWPIVAAAQIELYQAVATSAPSRIDLPRSPRRRRALAREEFGPTATAAAGQRPFALPGLRAGGPLARLCAAAIDQLAELVARVHR